MKWLSRRYQLRGILGISNPRSSSHEYPGTQSPNVVAAAPEAQAALAYDAAMVEIHAIKGLVAAGKTPTRATVLAAVAATKETGVTGAIAFNKLGDPATPPPFAVYTCDAKGAWTYRTTIGG